MSEQEINSSKTKKTDKPVWEFHSMGSPLGKIFFAAHDNTLRSLMYESGWEDFAKKQRLKRVTTNLVIQDTIQQIKEYLQGSRTEFSIPCHLEGTDFQIQAWKALSHIPYGQTLSYLKQAEFIQRPKAVRAIGSANGQNPISLIYPCHRVINQNGKLGGYGGGLEAKSYLLEMEKDFARKEPKINNLIFLNSPSASIH